VEQVPSRAENTVAENIVMELLNDKIKE